MRSPRTPQMVVELDRAGKILNAESSEEAGLNFVKLSDVGKRVQDLLPAHLVDEVLRCIEESLRTQKVVNRVHEVRRKDGIRYYDSVTIPLDLSRVLRIVQDVTESRRAEEALVESERRYRTVVEHAFDGFFIIERDGRIADVNRRACEDHGYPREELLGMPVMQIAPVNGREHLDLLWAQLETHRTVTVEGEHRRKDGTSFPVEVRIGRMGGEGRARFLTLVRDVTERRRFEEALQNSEERVRLLLNSTAEAIYGLNLKGNCTFCNPACVSLLGFERGADLLGRNMHELIHHTRSDGTPYPEEECRIYEALQKPDGIHVDEEVLWRADGTSFPAEYWSYPILKDGRTIGAVVTFLDITGRKKLERELLEVGVREQQRLGQDLHDGLGQDLTGIAFLSKALEHKLGDAPRKAAEARKLSKLVNNAIERTRALARGLMPGRVEEGSLPDALHELASATSKVFDVRCRFEGQTDLVVGEDRIATHLYHIAKEAVTNAVRHGRPENVRVELQESGGRVVLRVTDDGGGVRTPSGDGLGLRIMKARAEAIGGTVEFRKGGRGVVVECTFEPDSD